MTSSASPRTLNWIQPERSLSTPTIRRVGVTAHPTAVETLEPVTCALRWQRYAPISPCSKSETKVETVAAFAVSLQRTALNNSSLAVSGGTHGHENRETSTS
jgi:hypothetical protein